MADLDIGTLSGRVDLEDRFTPALMAVNTVLGATGEAVSRFSLLAVGSMTAAATAVAGYTASIIALGNKGSVIQGVEDSFARLAGALGDSDEMFNKLNEGVKGTVDSMDLMQTVNRALQAGVKLTADDMGILGATSRELAKSLGGDTVSSLNQLTTSLTTGSTMMLRRLGIQIDAEAAETKFAASIGVTREALNRDGQVQAMRIAMLEAMRERLDVLGTSELNFRERIQATTVAIGNWWDTLSKAIAKSPEINKAIDAVSSALQRILNENGQQVINAIVNGVERFARVIQVAAPYLLTLRDVFFSVVNAVKGFWNWLVDLNDQFGITDKAVVIATTAFNFLKDAFEFVKDASSRVVAAWKEMPAWLQELAKNAMLTGVGLTAIGYAASHAATPVMDFIKQVDLGINIVGNLAGAMYQWPLVFRDAVTWMRTLRGATVATTVALEAQTVATRLNNAEQLAFGFMAKSGTQLALPLSGAYTAVGTGATAAAAGTSKFAGAMALLTAPLTITIGLLTAAVVGIRLYTGNWDFLLDPLRQAWQTFLDLVDVIGEVGTLIYDFGKWVFEGVSKLVELAQWLTENTDLLELMFPPLALVIDGLKKLKEELGGLPDDMKKGFDLSNLNMFSVQFGNLSRAVKGLKDDLWLINRLRNGMGADDLPQVKSPFGTPDTLGPLAVPSLTQQHDVFTRRPEDAIEDLTNLNDAAKALAETLTGAALDKELATIARGVAAAGGAAGLTAYQYQQLGAQLETMANQGAKIPAKLQPILDHYRERVQVEQALQRAQAERLAAAEAGERRNALIMENIAQRGTELEQLRNQLRDQQEMKDLSSFDVRRRSLDRWLKTEKDKLFESAEQHQEHADLVAEIYKNLMLEIQTEEYNALYTPGNAGAPNRMLPDTRTSRFTGQNLTWDPNANNGMGDWVRDARTATESINMLSDSFAQLAQTAGDTFGGLAQWLGTTISAMKLGGQAGMEMRKAIEGSGTDWVQLAVGIMGAVGALDQATRSMSRVKNIAGGAMTGAKIGMAFGPVGAGIGAGVGALVGAFRDNVGPAVNDMRDAFVESQGGLDNIYNRLVEMGRMDLWEPLVAGPKDLKAIEKAIEDIQKATEELDGAMDRYGLTLDMTLTDQERMGRLAKQLVADAKALSAAGFSNDQLAGGMADQLNELVRASIQTGQKIPRALQPIIESLIRMGGLTEDNARAMLGLAEDTMPSLADITEAAERYGLTLDQLGPKVQQLSINEQAEQMVKDFKLFEQAGVDMGVVLGAAKDQIQEMVLKAMSAGLTLPEAMRPYIQSLIDAGELVDENGEKLRDLSGLNFERPLTDAVDDLILKLDDLIEAFKDVGKTDVPIVPIRYRYEEVDADGKATGKTGPPSAHDIPPPTAPADSQPASTSSTSSVTVNHTTTLDGRVIARNQVKYIPTELTAQGR